MDMTLHLQGRRFQIYLANAHDLCIPVSFAGPQLSVFAALPAQTHPLQAGNFVGSVAQGGSCNCDIHTFSPHTSGTHTECIGHITRSAVSIYETLQHALTPATLITVTPLPAAACSDTYGSSLRSSDMLITADMLRQGLSSTDVDFHRAVILRTLPNDDSKRTRNYDDPPVPPFFSTEAMHRLLELNVEHLLVDLPSIDRLDDGGLLANHRIFWDLQPGSTGQRSDEISTKTVTELIYAPQTVADGRYLLNLQVAPLLADAAPSRPILYPVRAL